MMTLNVFCCAPSHIGGKKVILMGLFIPVKNIQYCIITTKCCHSKNEKNCKDFEFYFQLRNPESSKCLDSPALEDDMNKPVGIWSCHLQGSNQVKES